MDTIRVAAIQMRANVGAVASNLSRAESLVREAFRRGAEWVIRLPAFSAGPPAAQVNRGRYDGRLPGAVRAMGQPVKELSAGQAGAYPGYWAEGRPSRSRHVKGASAERGGRVLTRRPGRTQIDVSRQRAGWGEAAPHAPRSYNQAGVNQ
jgi:hypothetical protein